MDTGSRARICRRHGAPVVPTASLSVRHPGGPPHRQIMILAADLATSTRVSVTHRDCWSGYQREYKTVGLPDPASLRRSSATSASRPSRATSQRSASSYFRLRHRSSLRLGASTTTPSNDTTPPPVAPGTATVRHDDLPRRSLPEVAARGSPQQRERTPSSLLVKPLGVRPHTDLPMSGYRIARSPWTCLA